MSCEGWIQKRLADIADTQTGPFGSQLHNEDYVEHGTPIVTVEHLGETGFTHQNLPRVKESDVKRLSKYTLNEGDIVFSRVGSVDRCSYVRKSEDGWLFSGRCLRVRIKSENDPQYLLYYFKHPNFKEHIRSIAVGATMPSLNTKLLSDVLVTLPPISEQRAIANILSSLDDKIELNNRMNKTLEEIAQALFKRWFVDFEFPDENGNPYKSSGGKMIESELGMIPEGWEVFDLIDTVKQIKPGTNFQPKRIESGIPFLNVRNVNTGSIDLSDVKYISEEDYHIVHKSWKPEINDVLISRIGTMGLVAVIRDVDLPLAVHYNFIDIKTQRVTYQFLYFYLKSEFFQLQYKTITKASVQDYVTIDEVERLKILLPISISDQYELEHSFISCFNKLTSLQKQNEILTQIRDTLLPKLMSGEIRVPIAEE